MHGSSTVFQGWLGLLLTVKQEGTLLDPLLWFLAWRLSVGQSCLQLCISFSCRFLTDCSATLERASARMRRLWRQRQAVRRSLWSLAVTAVDSRVFWCSTVRISSKVSCACAILCTCSCRRSKFCASLLFRGDGDFCVRLDGILVMQLGMQSPCNVVSSGLSKAAAGSIADIGYLLQSWLGLLLIFGLGETIRNHTKRDKWIRKMACPRGWSVQDLVCQKILPATMHWLLRSMELVLLCSNGFGHYYDFFFRKVHHNPSKRNVCSKTSDH